MQIRPGGSAANTAAWAAWAVQEQSFDRPVQLIARVGGDDASWHREALSAAGVEPHLIIDDTAVTTRLVALIDEQSGERTMLTDRGAGLGLEPDELREHMFTGAGWVHLSGYLLFADGPRRAFRQIVEWCTSAGVPWSVDPASVGFLADLGRETATSLLRGAALAFPNADEALFLAGVDSNTPAECSVDAAAVALGGLFATVVVTCGADGAIVASNGSVVGRIEAESNVVVVDAVGAGDAFAGAWLAHWLDAEDIERCLNAASRTAAVALRLSGGRPET